MKKIIFTISALLLIVQVFSQTDTTFVAKEDPTVIPVITITESDLDSDDQSQNISGLLQSSRDIFVSTAGFTFGQTRFRIRGYDSENTTVLMSGVPLNDMETGRAYWSAWGGLNDVTRWQEIDFGISASPYSFGGVSGATNIEARASKLRPGTRLTYSSTNRAYRNRLMATYNSGMLDNGWAFSVSGSRRWAEEGYVEGTFYDAWSYFVSVEKKLNSKHSLGFIAFAAPSQAGRAGVVTQEAYDLAGSNYYNPNWGYQNGEKRNSRVGTYNQPRLLLTHYWEPDKSTKLTTSAAYFFGRYGTTALEWYDAADPRPDYYRNLPSYYKDNPAQFEYYTNQWQNNESFRQLDWDFFYFANSKNLFTINNAYGIEGNSVTGNFSKYIIEDRRNDHNQFQFNTNLWKEINPHFNLNSGLNVSLYKGRTYKVAEDLLGGDFYINIDKFAEQDVFDPLQSQNDLRTPNKPVYEGDVFGYDYDANVNSVDAFVQANFTYPKFDYFVALNLSATEFWRTGHMQNGKFPNESLGDSEKQSFTNYGVKGGVTYKITGRHYVIVNGMYLTRAPYFRDSYISPRTRDHVVSNLDSEKVLSGDISYVLRAPNIQARATLYYTEFNDQVYSRSFYHETLRSFVNYQMTGVDTRSSGAELGVDYKLTSTINLTAVAGLGQLIYNSRPLATISQDNNSDILAENRKIYLKNYYVGGSPQTALSGGIKYNSPKYWWIGANINYFDDIYLEPNPDRRSEGAAGLYNEDDIRFNELLYQEKLSSAYTVDIFGGKSWRIKQYYIALNLSVNNVLNETNFAFGGFEQFRYDPNDLEKFPPKYFYLYGIQYYANLSFRF
ncbi:MAG: TonB-dependent receptor plug domain-containing protein [Bacteroidales bacterium]|nr:TonB-dependent receptor plug domain-containing protein [Bacteroidales bacterium]